MLFIKNENSNHNGYRNHFLHQIIVDYAPFYRRFSSVGFENKGLQKPNNYNK